MKKFLVGFGKYLLGLFLSLLIMLILDMNGYKLVETNPFYFTITLIYTIPYTFKQLITKPNNRKYENLEVNLLFMLVYLAYSPYLLLTKRVVYGLMGIAIFIVYAIVIATTKMPKELKEKRRIEAEKNALNKQLKEEIDKNIVKLPLGVSVDLIHRNVLINNKNVALDSIVDLNILEDSEVIESHTTKGDSSTKGKTHKSLGSTLVRGAVGTAVFGPIGGVVGVATAKSKTKSNTNSSSTFTTTSRVTHYYTLEILTDNMVDSIITLRANDRLNVNARADIMNVYYGILNSDEAKSSNEEVIKELEDKIEKLNGDISRLNVK